ncbi:MAG: sensor histidine kinase, partial [Pseudoclavibacter sp.]
MTQSTSGVSVSDDAATRASGAPGDAAASAAMSRVRRRLLLLTGTQDRDPSSVTETGFVGWWKRNAREMRWVHWTIDVVFAVILEIVIGWPFVMLASSRVYFEPLLVLPWVLYFAAIVLRRPMPAVAVLLCVVAVAYKVVVGAEPHGQDLAIGIVIYSAAAYGTRSLRWVAVALCGLMPALLIVVMSIKPMRSVFLSIYETVIDGGVLLATVIGVVIWAILTFLLFMCWLAGTARRSQARAEDAAHRREVAELESLRNREQLFVEQERNRIARDMHDVVAHSLAVVVAQADGGRYAMRANPKAGEESLTTIAETAREALYEVRGLLAQLRHSQPEGPQRGFADLPAVLERMRVAGLLIEIEVQGTPRPLGRTADNAMFRLVQEACTNALRHGDPRVPTVISVAWSDDLHVRVTNAINPVPPPPRADSGHGLIGMRERIVTAGGRLAAERHGAYFVVNGVVPTANAPSRGEPGRPVDGAPVRDDRADERSAVDDPSRHGPHARAAGSD